MRTEHAVVSDPEPVVPGFLDRLGDRVRLTGRGSPDVEILRLRPELTASPLFELAVRRRADQLAAFIHPHCARVRQIGQLPAPDGRLLILSDAIDGWRLSEVLEAADECGVGFHPDAVLFLLRQLLGAVASLHEVAPGISHGALGTERLVVTVEGRVVVTESVLGGALRHLPPMAPDRLWRDLRLAVADGEAQPFGRLTDLRQIGMIALSLALGRQLRRDEYPTRLAGLLQDSTPARPGFGKEGLGPAVRGWLGRVLSLTDDLTPWSVAEARRELDRVVEIDRRLAFAPTGVPLVLGRVADYYAAAVDIPVPVHQPPAPTDRKTGPVLVRPPEPAPLQDPPADTVAPPSVIDDPQPGLGLSKLTPGESPPALEVAPIVPDESWPEPSVRPAVDELVGSKQEPIVEIRPALVFPELPLQSGVVEDQPRPRSDANELQPSPLPLASIQGDDRGRRGQAAEGASTSRLLFGVQAADTVDPVMAPSGSRSRTLVGIGAAALLIVALGGYAALRPAAVTTPAVRQASSPSSTAGPDAASPTAAPAAAAASRGDAQGAPSTPRSEAALAPAAEPERPAPTGTIEVVAPLSLTVSEDGRALGKSGEPIRVPAGRHNLTIGRDDLGYRAAQVVDVTPGRPQRIELSLPSGFANLNATPWAEVWIDGRKIGETPLGRVQLTIGPHEVQFRHPELGDQTRTLTVTTGTVALLSVELKK
jgi:hypothetical protein